MTSAQMHVAFKFGLDKFDSLNYPNFEPDEIDLLLNEAQDRFVKQRYGFTNTKKQSFEETQKRTEDIKAIVVNSVLIPAATAVDNIDVNAQFVTLPTDHWFIIHERCTISYLDCKGVTIVDRAFTEAIQHNDFTVLMSSPFSKPNNNKVLRLMEKGRVELIHAPNVTLINYLLRYIKEPIRISITAPITSCELSPHTHQEVVDEAVRIALEGIEAKRLQSFIPAVQNTQE